VQYAVDSVIVPGVKNDIQNLTFDTQDGLLTCSANFSHASINLVSSMFRISSYISMSALPSASVKGLPLAGLTGGVTDLDRVRVLGRGLVARKAVGRVVEPFERALVRVVKGRSGTWPGAVGDEVTSGRG
jgi:hypothetical protein